MPTYETIFITPPTLAEDEEKATVELLAQIVSEGGGSFTVNERLGRRRLAYPIKKHDDGVYTRFLYDAGVDVPQELERRIRISDKVLRSLTVKLEREWAVATKEQAVRDAERRKEAEIEAARQAELDAEAAKEAAEKAEAEAAAAPAEPAESTDAAEPTETAAPAETAEATAPTTEEKTADAPGEA